jgi:hypothetical protein
VQRLLEHQAGPRGRRRTGLPDLGDYKTACEEIVAAFGKTRLVGDLGPDDFAALRNRMAKKWGHHRLGKTIQFVRCVFKYAFDADLIESPIRFGPGFQRPSK